MRLAMAEPTIVVHSDQDILGGTPVFVGTRVPLRNLIDYIERGHNLDEFLDAFPSVSRQQALAALDAAHQVLADRARLVDEQLPRQLARELAGHVVRTVQQEGWAGLGNGELLERAAENGFDVFVTADQNLQFQQNLAQSQLAVIVLVAPSNTLDDLAPLVPLILQAVANTLPGEVRRVSLA
jgi:uncharacterized protein (DUF433 family)/predicted nuclease of predicted toxin-antitoxin system